MANRTSASGSLARHALVGCLLVAALFGGLGVWAATTELSGAVVASGSIIVEGGSRRVQHAEGGIVGEFRVKDGDRVEGGDLLVRLDGTTTAASLAMVEAQLREAMALKARLLAEGNGTDIAWPNDVAEDDPGMQVLIVAQRRLSLSRAEAQQALTDRLGEQIEQIGLQVSGLEAQRAAVEAELAIVEEEERRMATLLEDGLIELPRVTAARRETARLKGEAARLLAEAASARTAAAERRIQIAQVASEFQTEVLAELQTIGLRIAELSQQKIAAQDRLSRLEVRAPASGIVHESIVQTVGGVVAAGETLMLIVPVASQLLVEARVFPIDVDKLSLGQEAVVKFSGLDQRTAPDLHAAVSHVSPDLSYDAATGAPYYLVKLSLPEAELDRLPETLILLPGMPAEAFIQTSNRTVLAYLIDPLAKQVSHAFRED